MKKFYILCGFFFFVFHCVPLSTRWNDFVNGTFCARIKLILSQYKKIANAASKPTIHNCPFLFAVDDCLNSLRWLYFPHVMKIKCLLDVACFLKKKSEYNHLFSHCNTTGQLNLRCQCWVSVHRGWRRTILCSSILALRNCMFTHSSSLSLYLYLGLWRKSQFTENKPQS